MPVCSHKSEKSRHRLTSPQTIVAIVANFRIPSLYGVWY